MDLNIRSSTVLLVMCHGLSLVDQYWVKEENSTLRWEEINFFDNDFSDDVGKLLFGEQVYNPNLASPNNTSGGWLKKKWKIVNSDRVLIKAGSGESLQEPINEALVAAINRRTGFKNVVDYWILWGERNEPYSVCSNFITRDTELISGYYLLSSVKKPNNISEYTHYLNCCESLDIPEKETIEFMKYMFTLDYLVLNQDRRYNNFGIIKDLNTGQFRYAPIFDTGTSLWNGVATPFIGAPENDEAKPFRKTHEEQIKLMGKSDLFTSDVLYGIEEEFRDLLFKSLYISEERRDKLVKCFKQRVDKVTGK